MQGLEETELRKVDSTAEAILGDPGATSRDDAMFSGENLLQGLKSPWELILTEPVPEVVEFRPADWTISDEVQPGNSVAFLHDVQQEDCRGGFQKKNIQRSRGNRNP